MEPNLIEFNRYTVQRKGTKIVRLVSRERKDFYRCILWHLSCSICQLPRACVFLSVYEVCFSGESHEIFMSARKARTYFWKAMIFKGAIYRYSFSDYFFFPFESAEACSSCITLITARWFLCACWVSGLPEAIEAYGTLCFFLTTCVEWIVILSFVISLVRFIN